MALESFRVVTTFLNSQWFECFTKLFSKEIHGKNIKTISCLKKSHSSDFEQIKVANFVQDTLGCTPISTAKN
jgi:hypothetical protein